MDPVQFGARALASIQPAAESASVAGARGAEAGAFLDQLKGAIAQANDVQLQASQAVDDLMTGKTDNIHRTMVALQQADISFQLMMQVRNKLVGAYEEIQRMQI
ncbi:MAG TPA: flagellar hook-basal body complex protein FliE [Nitrospira sp.]|nr:flagellar hook-basal body complex protein FliE [Nitrospira sp.]